MPSFVPFPLAVCFSQMDNCDDVENTQGLELALGVNANPLISLLINLGKVTWPFC